LGSDGKNHGVRMGQFIYVYMNYIWTIYELYMVYIWFIYGFYMVYIWFLYVYIWFYIYIYMMWLKQFHKPSPSHHHFYRRYAYPSLWVVYGIVLTTWYIIYIYGLYMATGYMWVSFTWMNMAMTKCGLMWAMNVLWY
jgi:hypothetical protein